MSAVEHALAYLARGWAVVPIPPRSKGPTLPSWQTLRLSSSEVPRYFSPGDNCGVILGEASHGLVDVDLDCPEAVRRAPEFLPPTLIFGRDSKPRSHWIYTMSPAGSTRQFQDPVTGDMLV